MTRKGKYSLPSIGIEKEVRIEDPKKGIESVGATDRRYILDPEAFPWLRLPSNVDVPVVTVSFVEHDNDRLNQIYYGSSIGHHSGLVAMADAVPDEQSVSAERCMFKALPHIINKLDHPNIDKVPGSTSSLTVFKTSKLGRDVARLVFAVDYETPCPTVIRVGLSNHKQQQRMLGVITRSKQSRRRRRDG